MIENIRGLTYAKHYSILCEKCGTTSEYEPNNGPYTTCPCCSIELNDTISGIITMNQPERFTFFWNKSPFSQFHPCKFTVGGTEFYWAEQYMMAQKARMFGDGEAFKAILSANSAKECKSLGRQVRNFNVGIWNRESFDIVYEGNYAKFTQNKKLLEALLATRGTTLVEASPYDKIWGIGLAADDPRAQSRETWLGENRLGEVLTKLRNDLDKS